MLKHTALVALLTLGLAPAAAAQATAEAPRDRRPIERLMRAAQVRIGLGVRSGRISRAELVRLRADMRHARAVVRELRQSGTLPTAEARRQVRQAIRTLHRHITVANRHPIRGR